MIYTPGGRLRGSRTLTPKFQSVIQHKSYIVLSASLIDCFFALTIIDKTDADPDACCHQVASPRNPSSARLGQTILLVYTTAMLRANVESAMNMNLKPGLVTRAESGVILVSCATDCVDKHPGRRAGEPDHYWLLKTRYISVIRRTSSGG